MVECKASVNIRVYALCFSKHVLKVKIMRMTIKPRYKHMPVRTAAGRWESQEWMLTAGYTVSVRLAWET